MRLVVQRVSEASVRVGGRVVGAIEAGLVVLIGVHESDTDDAAAHLARKMAELRIFSDEEGRFNLSLKDVGGRALVVSQFTLLGDSRKGRRPSFTAAARPEVAEPLIDLFCAALAEEGVGVERGVFGASMEVSLVNDGPVTFVIDSDDFAQPRRGVR